MLRSLMMHQILTLLSNQKGIPYKMETFIFSMRMETLTLKRYIEISNIVLNKKKPFQR